MTVKLALRGFSDRISAAAKLTADSTNQADCSSTTLPPPDRYRGEPIIHNRSVKWYKCLCGQRLSFPARKSGAPPCKAMRCPICQQSHWR